MKNVKMSLANIQGRLSRKELKNIMAGSGEFCYGACEQPAWTCKYIRDCGGGALLRCEGYYLPFCWAGYV